ncbi:MAG TPA: hypothetical protein VI168_10745 [Croceibacterium sp.]
MPAEDYSRPAVRRLRVYAFDPQASTKIDTAAINVATIELPWETEREEKLKPGPVNDYLEVIDVDPVSGQFYDPVDLNHPYLLAQDGLAPSEGDPRFHQQMVFAVAMKTIRAFERALGRRMFWAPRKTGEVYQPVKRLRVYPHALREPNAYYSKQKVALLFGYFRSTAADAGASWVFTALSHDVVVHETTHAILDGLHRRYAEPTSIDSLAFHEAFADIVALLSHFTLTEAVEAEIAANGGRFDQRTLMTGLARQFGRATGRSGALREAIDDKIGGEPDPKQLASLSEPHARGAVLVAAVFEAFLTIYQRRSADLMRLAGHESGGAVATLHPDLVGRLSREATKSADHVLRMCLRALDYLPPVDVRFGEFLRAIVTADTDLVPFDPFGYRIALIEAFRRRGIVPDGCLSLAADSLLWEGDSSEPPLTIADLPALNLDYIPSRKEAAAAAENNRRIVQKWLMRRRGRAKEAAWQAACGVLFGAGLDGQPDRHTVLDWSPEKGAEGPRRFPKVEVHSVRTTRRAGPDGQDVRQLVIEVTQRRRGFFDTKQQADEEQYRESPCAPDFTFRGGATLIFDMFTGHLRYTVSKRITDDRRLAVQRDFLLARAASTLGMAYSGAGAAAKEPFAMIHRGGV